jgi:bile acid-coenzyme A ligase
MREPSVPAADRTALIGLDRRGTATPITWAELTDDANRRAAEIRASAEHSIVAVPADASPATVLAIAAVVTAGHTVFPYDPSLPAPTRDRLFEQARRSLGGTEAFTERVVGGRPVWQCPVPSGGGSLLATGGTSGRSRLVHRDRLPGSQPPPLFAATGWRPGQAQLLASAPHHVAPFDHLLAALAGGSTLVVPRVFDPDVVLDALARHRVGWTQLTPAHLHLLAPGLDRYRDRLDDLRGLVHTGAPCPPPTKRRFLDVLGGHRVFETYGSTEGHGVTLCRGEEWLARPGTVGRGFLTQIRILDPDGRALGPDQIGEVHMRSAQRTRYAGGVTRDGFRYVGDHGHLDRDGYLYLAGRADDLVFVGGENVYTNDIEHALQAHTALTDAAVIGLPEPVFGARLLALAVTHPDRPVNEDDLLRYCADRLPANQVPTRILLVDSLPRTSAGKLRRDDLRALADAAGER